MSDDLSYRYDVFLSHSGAQKPWVEVLARNLRQAGLRVFFDIWELVPGNDWVEDLHRALTDSRTAVLVMSPESYHSGWVGREYRTLLARNIRIVPVVFGTLDAAFPFLESIQWVDFRPPVDYRQAFARLLAGLRGEAPGSDPTPDLPEDSAPPLPGGQAMAREVFQRVRANRVMLVLGREGQDQARIAGMLAKEAQQRFAAGRIRILNLPVAGGERDDQALFRPSSRDAGLDDRALFRALSRDAGLDVESGSGAAFQAAVDAALRAMPGPWLWLVFGFENIGREAREQLAGIVRALGAQHGQFQVVLLGGERLHDLSYSNGALSIFHGAAEVMWPDPEADEMTGLPVVDPIRQARAMALAGGHPLLATDLMYVNGDEQALSAFLRAHPLLIRAVRDLIGDRIAWNRLHGFTRQDELGSFALIIADPVVRGLWWHNLIRRDPRTQLLCWRSVAIRDGVREVLEVLG